MSLAQTLKGHPFLCLLTSLFHGSAERRNSSALLLEKLLLLVAGFVFTAVLARWWSPQLFGQYQYLLALVALLSPFSAMGLNSLVSRELVRGELAPADDVSPDTRAHSRRELIAEVLGTALAIRLMGAALAGSVMAVAGYWLVAPEHRGILGVLVSAQLAHAFAVFDFYFESKVRSRVSALLRTANGLLFMALKLGWLAWQGSLFGVLALTALEWLLLACGWYGVYAVAEPERLGLKFNAQRALNLMGRSLWLLLSGIAAVVYLKMDLVMLGLLADKSQVAAYSLAARLSEVWYIIPGIVAASWFPRLLKLHQKSPTQYWQSLQHLCDGLAWSAVVIALVMTVFAKPLMALLFGEVYYDAGAILQIHIWAGVFIFMRALFSKWILVEDIPKYSLLTHGAGAVFNILLNYWFIPLWGGFGAAVATLVSYATASFLSLWLFADTRVFAKVMVNALLLPIRRIAYIRLD